MHKSILIVLLAIALIGSLAWNVFQPRGESPSESATGGTKQLWTCGMHPNVIQDHPGTCPICGMNLTPMNAAADASSGSQISIDPVTSQNIGIKTVLVKRESIARTVKTQGVVTADESRVQTVSLKFGGWINKLYVNRIGESVGIGQPLFDVFSPELVNAQREFLLAKPMGAEVLEAARLKLKNWGLADRQITALEQSETIVQNVTIHSPASGIVIEKVINEGANAMMGAALMTIADLSRVWILADVYESELPWVRLGQITRVRLESSPEEILVAEVSYIYPTVDANTQTAKIRLSLDNRSGNLKPGMIAEVLLTTRKSDNVLTIPRDAVVRSGRRDVIFVALDSGRFEPRKVDLGLEADGYTYEVTSGVSEGERIVSAAAFLLDSESQLQEALHKLIHGDGMTAADHDSKMPANSPGVADAPTMEKLYTSSSLYHCPMHAEIISADSGKLCPLCKMTLEAMPEKSIKDIRASSPYGCVMCPVIQPESKKDERCPVCNMKLTWIEKPER